MNSCMKLRVAEQRTAEQENIEPQNIEGWNRCALSFESIKLDRIPSFDIRHSIFTVRYSLFYPRNTQCITVVNPTFNGTPALTLNKIERFSGSHYSLGFAQSEWANLV